MQEWEYLVDQHDEGLVESTMQELFNQRGAEHWELVHVSASFRTFIFKRPATGLRRASNRRY
jgi:hypothetical protein